MKGFRMSDARSSTGITNARILDANFRFRTVSHLGWTDGVFSFSTSGSSPLDGADLWVVPGFTDAHVHLAWTDFSARAREDRAPTERDSLIAQNLRATALAGFTSARDAGGLSAQWIRLANEGDLPAPSISGSISLITAAIAHKAGSVERAVENALDNGATWIKLMATEGVTSTTDSMESHFSEAEFRRAVGVATEAGARVMVHAWGGNAISWAIDAGVGSIEHGIFLSPNQARAAAAAHVTFVPTLVIYRRLLAMIQAGQLSPHLFDSVRHVVRAHPRAVQTAMEHGTKIAVGTDFGTVEQHGSNIEELHALLETGLSPAEVLEAATVNGAQLLDGRCCPSGSIEERMPADAIIFRSNPLDPATFANRHAVVAVVKTGRMFSA